MYYWPLNAFWNMWFVFQNNPALAVDLEDEPTIAEFRILVKAGLGCSLQI